MKPLVSDALWERIEPLLPSRPPRRLRFPGRKPLDYRKILTGILFVLKTGIAWDDLPADTGYDAEPLRVLLRWLGITPLLGKRKREHGSGLGKSRWFVERTISWFHSFGRLRRRLDRLTELQDAFLRLGCSLICLRFVTS